MEKVLSSGFREVALQYMENRTEQVRFSQNSEDLLNDWNETSISVFAATGKKTVSTTISDLKNPDEAIEQMWKASEKIPDNPKFEGLNPKAIYPKTSAFPDSQYDLQDMALNLVNSALENGAERTAGVLYNSTKKITVKTNYNECTFETGGLEVLIRSFRGENTGQEARHFGKSVKVDSGIIEQIGRESAEPLLMARDTVNIEPGKHKVLMSPYVIGNIISYSSDFLSYYSVENELSCFSGLLDQQVSHNDFTLTDEPLDPAGVGFRVCDYEGTPTGKNPLIEEGVLKNYMHSYSTAKRNNAKTTGNAGILAPRAWQLKLSPGRDNLEDMLSEVDDGLWINNCWYTRYQDYRNAVFSTVPRDGVFLVKNGEIKGVAKGIRISDSVPSILKGVSGVSKETKTVKWWEEIAPSSMPSLLVDEVNITKGF